MLCTHNARQGAVVHTMQMYPCFRLALTESEASPGLSVGAAAAASSLESGGQVHRGGRRPGS